MLDLRFGLISLGNLGFRTPPSYIYYPIEPLQPTTLEAIKPLEYPTLLGLMWCLIRGHGCSDRDCSAQHKKVADSVCIPLTQEKLHVPRKLPIDCLDNP